VQRDNRAINLYQWEVTPSQTCGLHKSLLTRRFIYSADQSPPDNSKGWNTN